jgi:fibronectin type III domain protein/N-acetylmuramoyl-L-alanine amidase-like protein
MTLVRRRAKPLFVLLAAAFVGSLSGAQNHGSLSGRIVYMSGGHGWTFHNTAGVWYTQRGDFNDVVEDYGNLDQMNFFAAYCINAGATVVPFRPIGYQTNEVVLDNDSPGVSFVGLWSNSTATNGYFGTTGDVPYRFATLSDTEIATAHYRPTIPATGFYPVYTWAGAGSNRGRQLYRIRHTGGESSVRVPHHMVGNGWVYLGTYFLNAGTNASVVISNLRDPADASGVAIADAIRFGNGIGPSGYPREEECSRYWVQAALGVGAPSSIYDCCSDDGSDNVGTPPRMAAHMNREQSGSRYDRVFVSFHSNGGGGAARGTLALHNGNHPGESTTNQLRLAQLIGQEVNNDLVTFGSPPLEIPWYDRGTAVTLSRTDIAFGEINNIYIDDEFDATILEVAFHDNVDDARLLRDPKARQAVARATYQGVIRYMNEFATVPLAFLPEPPSNVRALARANGNVTIEWGAPAAGGSSASGYNVYISTNGYGFGLLGGVQGGSATLVNVSNLAPDTDWFFRVASTNAAGESLPSEVVGCRLSTFDVARVLYVNAYDRLDRFIAPRQTAGPGIGGPSGGTATFDRCQPRRMNSFDYIMQHGIALGRNGVTYDTCQNEAIASSQVRLTNYAAVIWACGLESTADKTFNATEQARVAEYLDRGGRLFASGSEIAWELNNTAFLSNYLHAALDTDDAGTYNFSALFSGIFWGNAAARFDDGTFGTYNVQFPDRLTPLGGAVIALVYPGSTAAAAIQSSNQLVYFGFPFESITTAAAREAYMYDIVKYFDVLPRPVILSFAPQSATLSWQAISGKRYRVQYKTNLAAAAWSSLPGDVTASSSVATKVDTSLALAPQKFYRVVMLEP